MWIRLYLICIALSIYAFDSTSVIQQLDLTDLVDASQTPIQHNGAIPLFLPGDQAQRSRWLTAWLQQKRFHLENKLIKNMIHILNYADMNHIQHNNIVTLIDYSRPANQKRLWVFDLNTSQLLFYTYVSHGLKSGALDANYFSNRFNSKASSMGVYRTDKPYYGRHGLSLKLEGLEPGFNDNAESRAIVMHGGWYAEEPFIVKYGRPGRSWGCPVVSDQLITPIIKSIKENSLFIVYYPSKKWLSRSKFLSKPLNLPSQGSRSYIESIHLSELREDVMLAQLDKGNKYHETEGILVLPADRYATLFHTAYPLNRMLRRQIGDQEYIALSTSECKQLIAKAALIPDNRILYGDIALVVPEIVMSHGYYATEMRKVGGVIGMHYALNSDQQDVYTLDLDNQSTLRVKTTHQFIRWLGL